MKYSDNPLFQRLHTAPWEEDVEVSSFFTLRKRKGDANIIAESERALDLVYFDAFAPEKQPEMWSEQLFRTLYAVSYTHLTLPTTSRV